MMRTFLKWAGAVGVAVVWAGAAWGQAVNPSSLPDGEVNVSYTQTLSADGFLPVVCCTWTLTPGAGWPGGLSFSPGTTMATISGVPTSGPISFSLTVSDGVSTVSPSYT